jgi:hypothetical protein
MDRLGGGFMYFGVCFVGAFVASIDEAIRVGACLTRWNESIWTAWHDIDHFYFQRLQWERGS